MSILIYH